MESHRRQGEDMGGALTIPHSLWPVIPGMGNHPSSQISFTFICFPVLNTSFTSPSILSTMLL